MNEVTIRVDPRLCTGAGQCVLTAPALFDQSADDGTVILLQATAAGALAALARKAQQLCPGRAIVVEES